MFRLQHPEPERAEEHLLMMGPLPSSQTCAFSPNTEHRAYTCQTICELLAVDYEGYPHTFSSRKTLQVSHNVSQTFEP